MKLSAMKLSRSDYLKIVDLALEEDAALQDISSSSVISPDKLVGFEIIAKERLVCCGLSVARDVFLQVDSGIVVQICNADGDNVLNEGACVMRGYGKALSILAAERVALNFLQHMSGVATLTRAFVSEVAGFNCAIRDTRKTIPGLRALQKYSVTMGGGCNHRLSLSDSVLIKDNHIAAYDSVDLCLDALFAALGEKLIEVEVECDYDYQAVQVLNYKVPVSAIMLDNWSPEQIKHFIQENRDIIIARNIKLEASGGVNLSNVKSYAASGVDYIAIGALTHSVKACDISLEITDGSSKGFYGLRR